MAGSLESTLANIPGYGGYLAKQQFNDQRESADLQQASATMGVLSAIQKAQADRATKDALAASGGDIEKAMQTLITSGNIAGAHALAPVYKIAEEARQAKETQTGMAALNAPPAPARPAMVDPQETQQAADQGTPVPTATPIGDPRQAQLARLKQMQLLYARNPAMTGRIQTEIDKIEGQKPMIEHNFSVGNDMVQPHISYDNGQTWTPVQGSKPSSKFAKQVPESLTQPKGDYSKTGEEFLATLPPEDRSVVQKLAQYEINPQALSTKGGHREKMLSLAAQYNPEYDDTQYANKRKAIMQFGSGPQGNTVRSLNVAIEHIDTLQRAADALKNGEFTPGNKAYNELAKVFGQTPPNTFEGIRDIVANEVVKGTIGNTGALQDRAEAAAKVKASSSPDQLKTLLNGWTELMGGQVKGLEQQYEGSTGLKNFREKYLRQRTKEAIALAESKATGTGAPAPATGGFPEGQTATGPNGQKIIFKGGKWQPTTSQ